MQSWSKWMKQGDAYIGLDKFGASGPGKDVYQYFDISIDNSVVVTQIIIPISVFLPT